MLIALHLYCFLSALFFYLTFLPARLYLSVTCPIFSAIAEKMGQVTGVTTRATKNDKKKKNKKGKAFHEVPQGIE
jgi:hypothetical protein